VRVRTPSYSSEGEGHVNCYLEHLHTAVKERDMLTVT